MSGIISPNRLEVSDRFPILGFTIRTDENHGWFEVAVATKPELFQPSNKNLRTFSNFFSTRATGALPVQRGEAVYLLPTEVLGRFKGNQKLYFALAVFTDPSRNTVELVNVPNENSTYVSLKTFTGSGSRRAMLIHKSHRSTSTKTDTNYGKTPSEELDWAGDTVMPGTEAIKSIKPIEKPKPVHTSSPETPPYSVDNASSAQAETPFEYDDGFGPMPFEFIDEMDQLSSRRIEEPMPNENITPYTSSSIRSSRQSRTFSNGQSFNINWNEVELVPQMTGMSCWAAAASMVVGWRDRICIDPSDIAKGSGHWAAYKQGLNPSDIPSLANAWGLQLEQPQCYTMEGLKNLLETCGPLWVAASVPSLHAIVVTGMYGDGTYDGTYIRINDPWGRASGTPGKPGTYNPTPGKGSQYSLTFRQFSSEYEAAADFPQVNIQILHSGGTDGRVIEAGSTAYSLGKTYPVSVQSSTGLSTADIGYSRQSRTFSNGQSFNINWNEVELVPQMTGMSCWAAAASMVVGWRDRICIDPSDIAKGSGHWAAYKQGLNPSDIPSLANAWGLQLEQPQCYTMEGLKNLLETCGPLWVAASVPSLHAIVVTGMYGDGT
ncbi:MAG: papain-like cysteine protease family protein, partial [bacterium]